MSQKYSQLDGYLCMSRFGIVTCLVLSVIVPDNRRLVMAEESVGHKLVELLVEQHARPVARALELLERAYGWTITYEDPCYIYEDDIRDVTLQVRRDLDKFEPGKAPKVLVPKGGDISLDYFESAESHEPVEEPDALVRRLLLAHNSGGGAGKFDMSQTGEMFHVFPVQARNAAGQFVPCDSFLGVRISLPDAERTGLETLAAIRTCINQKTGKRLFIGAVPLNLFAHHRVRLAALDEPARNVLVRTLQSFSDWKLSWQLFWGPNSDAPALNIHIVSRPEGKNGKSK